VKHNYTGYSNGCRCDICRTAGKRYRDQRRSQPVPAWLGHGTLSAYQSFGCRCETCVEARKGYDRARRKGAGVS
jgi:hypothetical protein